MLTGALQPVERGDTLKKEQFVSFLVRLWGELALLSTTAVVQWKD